MFLGGVFGGVLGGVLGGLSGVPWSRNPPSLSFDTACGFWYG